MVEANSWRSARYGVLALSLETGDTLYARGAQELLAPASNMKLLTTAAALRYLGPDFRYQTFLLADGSVEGDRLRGDLVLYGTGDPGLSDQFQESKIAAFEALADSLRAAGIAVVEGDVVGDGSFFTGPLLAEGWDSYDLNDWFVAPASALTFNENVVTLRVRPSSPGQAPAVHTIPAGADITLDVSAVTARRGTRIRIRRRDPGEPIRIYGSMTPSSPDVWRQIAVMDPPHLAASVFRAVLLAKGIEVLGGVRSVDTPAASAVTARSLWAPVLAPERRGPRVLARHESPPLLEYLKVMNKKSHNLFAELTLKTLGRVVEGEGSYDAGARVVKHFLADEVQTDTSGLRLLDGSGLSALNRVSPATFVAVLRHMAGTGLWDAYWETLPEAGNPRELRRMYRTPAAGNLRAKTGTIRRVSALSGVVRSANGERIIFSIVANDVPSTSAAKRVEDRIGARLASFERPFEPSPQEIQPVAIDGQPPAITTVAGGAADAPSDAERPTTSAEPRVHTIRPGENLTLIARRYGVRMNALIDANPGLSPRRLVPGAELLVPAEESSEDPGLPAGRTDIQTHRIRAGESFWVIARSYGLSLNDLIAANPEVDPGRIRPGQTIRIPPAP